MRIFIAIEIPPSVKTALASLQTELRRAAADVGWTKPENMHLTLRFLGEVEEARLGEVSRVCDEAAATVSSFTLRLSGAGVFPNFRQPRVLWAGVAGEIETAAKLQAQLEKVLVARGFPPEDKPFKPHLTIGRVKTPRNARQVAALAEIQSLPELAFEVSEIVLIKSELHPAGARYTALAKSKLLPDAQSLRG